MDDKELSVLINKYVKCGQHNDRCKKYMKMIELFKIELYVRGMIVMTLNDQSQLNITHDIETIQLSNDIYSLNYLRFLQKRLIIDSEIIDDVNHKFTISKEIGNGTSAVVWEGKYEPYHGTSLAIKYNTDTGLDSNGNRKYELVDLRHELFIGLNFVNPLREEILNFAYVLGGFGCNNVLLSRERLAECKSNHPDQNVSINYVIYENIIGDSVWDSLNKNNLNPVDFVSLTLQLILSLKIANEFCDFGHNDLHATNIILRKITKEDLLYRYNDKIVFIKTDFIATIIDYGLSHVKEGNINYGVFDYSEYNIFNSSNNLQDMYIFLTSCFKSGNRKLKDTLIEILKFYKKDKRNKSNQEIYSSQTNTTEYISQEKTLDDLFNFIINNKKLKDIIDEIITIE